MSSLFLLAAALSMDAFAACLSRGVAAPAHALARTALTTGTAIGVAHGVMPLVGWSLSAAMTARLRDFDHWIAFALLLAIGLRMLWEARDPDGDCPAANGGASLAALAFATSIDAAVAGGTFAGLEQPVAVGCAVIAVSAFLFAAAGVCLGRFAGVAAGRRAQVLGALVLTALAVKIVIDHEFLGG